MILRPIQVTEPYLPVMDEYVEYLKGVWTRNHLTNQGPLVKELEQKLQAYHQLAMPVHCVTNGALGLQIAIKALKITGEIITTPFSYVATTACPLWEGCTVVFADIEPEYLTLDPSAVEAAITSKTEAILATHVFGNPCDVEALERIAKKHKLALIYDAAHAFGVSYKGRSILEWGDASMVSTHATKLFHTVEGGFVYSPNQAVATRMEWMRRFGHHGHEGFYGVGTNAKMTEFHAAMGLAVLKEIGSILKVRKTAVHYYEKTVRASSHFAPALTIRPETDWNWSYYPIVCASETLLLQLIRHLNDAQIFPRRYFYPSLNDVPFLGAGEASCSISSSLAKRIICLPLAAGYGAEVTDRICCALTEFRPQ